MRSGPMAEPVGPTPINSHELSAQNWTHGDLVIIRESCGPTCFDSTKKRDAGASLYAIERCELFSRFCFCEFLFELVDPVLQRR